MRFTSKELAIVKILDNYIYRDISSVIIDYVSTADLLRRHRKVMKKLEPNKTLLTIKIYGYNSVIFARAYTYTIFKSPSESMKHLSLYLQRTFIRESVRFTEAMLEEYLEKGDTQRTGLETLVLKSRLFSTPVTSVDYDSVFIGYTENDLQSVIKKVKKAMNIYNPTMYFHEHVLKVAIMMVLDKVDYVNFNTLEKYYKAFTNEAFSQQYFISCLKNLLAEGFIEKRNFSSIKLRSKYKGWKFRKTVDFY